MPSEYASARPFAGEGDLTAAKTGPRLIAGQSTSMDG